jgi:hypothetical protein
MSDIDFLPDKSKNRMELKIRKYKSELKLNRLIFLALTLLNLIVVMVLSFTGNGTETTYTMNLTYVRICIGLSFLTVLFSIAPIIKSIIE